MYDDEDEQESMVFDWTGANGPPLTVEDFDNSVIGRILRDQFHAPFNEPVYERPMTWPVPHGKFGPQSVYIPGKKGKPNYPRKSSLTKKQHLTGLKVLSCDNVVQPKNYPLPTPSDYESFEQMQIKYKEEQQEYRIWARHCWKNGDCARTLCLNGILEKVYDAHFELKKHEISILPTDYSMVAQIILEPRTLEALEFQHIKDFKRVNIKKLPKIKCPHELVRNFNIMEEYAIPDPCPHHPTKLILPHEEKVTNLSLPEADHQLAQFAIKHDIKFIASEKALACLLEYEHAWKLPVYVEAEVHPEDEGCARTVVVLGSRFSLRKECGKQRCFEAFQHLLRNKFISSTAESCNSSDESDMDSREAIINSDADDRHRIIIDNSRNLNEDPDYEDAVPVMQVCDEEDQNMDDIRRRRSTESDHISDDVNISNVRASISDDNKIETESPIIDECPNINKDLEDAVHVEQGESLNKPRRSTGSAPGVYDDNNDDAASISNDSDESNRLVIEESYGFGTDDEDSVPVTQDTHETCLNETHTLYDGFKTKARTHETCLNETHTLYDGFKTKARTHETCLNETHTLYDGFKTTARRIQNQTYSLHYVDSDDEIPLVFPREFRSCQVETKVAELNDLKMATDIIGENPSSKEDTDDLNCTCIGTRFEAPPPRSFKKWHFNNNAAKKAYPLIIHSSHEASNGKNEVILEPIVEWQPELGACKQSPGRLRALAFALMLRPGAEIINVRVDHDTGNVIVIDKMKEKDFAARHGDIKSEVAGKIQAALDQMRLLKPGQYILEHESCHGANAMLYSAAQALVADYKGYTLSLRPKKSTLTEDEEMNSTKIPPELSCALLPYHKDQGILPLAFAAAKKKAKRPKHFHPTRSGQPPQAIKGPKKATKTEQQQPTN